MGTFTELNMAVRLKEDTPSDVISVINSMIDGAIIPIETPNHPFFKTDRWWKLFVEDSYYFAGDTHSTFKFNGIMNQYTLTIRSNLKNYSYEIELFLNFLHPYIDTYGFIGYEMDQRCDEPDLIYNYNSRIIIGGTEIDSDYVSWIT